MIDLIDNIHNTKNYNKHKYKALIKKKYNINTVFGKNNKKNNNKWPVSTQIYCFWDCHPFSNIPISIPTKVENGVYHFFGCFCSLECAAAYIFKNFKDNKWEIYSLLHTFYNQTRKN